MQKSVHNKTPLLMWLIFGLVAVAVGDRKETTFNTSWRFALGEQRVDVTESDFDDSQWHTVRVPHDWAIAGPFDPNEHGFAGKLPWKGVGWYRKQFTLNEADKGKRIYLDFDGVMAFPKVYVNGSLAGEWDYGYISFRVDATPYVRFGQVNTIAVEVDTRKQGTRWYPGAGIYRKVKLTVCSPIHIGHWATFVSTPAISDAFAALRIQTCVENHSSRSAAANVEFTIISPDDKVVASSSQSVHIAVENSVSLERQLTVLQPQPWDIANPQLYTLVTTIRIDGQVADIEKTVFGIREFEFTANDGFHLNGRRVQLQGVNLHHDHGPLGAAFYTRAMERQLEIMRDIGVNAIRTSHNPPAPELLELCDKMGFLVWNECFDKWDLTAGRLNGQPPLKGYSARQIRNFVLRDRNHPSIIVWSIGNEINNAPEDPDGKSPERVGYMREFIRSHDDTRPVGIGCHIPQTVERPILDALDLTGWNYMRRYEQYRKQYPDKPIVYSESASTVSTRGCYELPLPTSKTQYSSKFQVCSYDMNATSWSDIPDVEFALMEKDRFAAGEFVWTGFDYLGEPTPFERQARSSYFGIVDLCGIPKDRYYLYRSYWRPEATTVHILPHWNWLDRIGKIVPVFVYTNGDAAELFLNGRSLGRRAKGERPRTAVDLMQNATVTASSEQDGNPIAALLDCNRNTRWCASNSGPEQWVCIDLGRMCQIGYINVDFEFETGRYSYAIRASTDGKVWEELVSADDDRQNGVSSVESHTVQTTARYVKVAFNNLKDHAWASIRTIEIRDKIVESDYYLSTYDYRLRWNEVKYEPGELKAIVYKGDKQIGQTTLRTAGTSVRIRLTPDRCKLRASGEDLSYILVEALDDQGTLCPLAGNRIDFLIKGPAELAGVGNGNPMSFEPFQSHSHELFNGKAMLIVRTIEGQAGDIRITAKSSGLEDGYANLYSIR
jgi:beta-galactosidase